MANSTKVPLDECDYFVDLITGKATDHEPVLSPHPDWEVCGVFNSLFWLI